MRHMNYIVTLLGYLEHPYACRTSLYSSGCFTVFLNLYDAASCCISLLEVPIQYDKFVDVWKRRDELTCQKYTVHHDIAVPAI